MQHKVSFFKQSSIGLNSEFSLSKTCCLTKVIEPSLTYYSTDVCEEKKFIPIPKFLVLCEMQTASSRIRSWVAGCISYNETERQDPQTAVSDEPTGINRSKRPQVAGCRLREFSNCTQLDKNKTGGEPSEREMKCDNKAMWIEFLS